jgi:uncharacterized protein
MAIKLYDLTVPVFLRGLGILSAVLEKGRLDAADRTIPEVELMNARLAPDMLTLAGQVQRASDTAKFAAVRIGGVENVRFADEEATFADLQGRLGRTRDFLEAVPRAVMDEAEGRTLTVRIGRDAEIAITAEEYALKFALPNFFFHVTTAYDILRHRGVVLGKNDYIGLLS